ncbi:MAG: type IV secretion system protein [Phenylobacterium sp.]|uniref:type IV secretion system protein n=1 Tax=Phenylobacterium sp. TaxID=1871053 RepID=UPI00391DDBBA
MKRHLVTTAVFAGSFLAATAPAAMIVHDPTNFAKLVEQARTAIDQLETLKRQVAETEKLVTALENGAELGTVADVLSAPEVSAALPAAADLGGLAAEIEGLGELGARAKAIRRAERIYTPDEASPHAAALERSGARVARDLALTEAVSEALAARDRALQDLAQTAASAESPRAVLDVQAQAQAATARAANDQLRLAALQWAARVQEAQEAQRLAEAAAAARAERRALFRATFAPEA